MSLIPVHVLSPYLLLVKEAQLDSSRYCGIRHQGWKGWETKNKNRDSSETVRASDLRF